MKTHRLLAAEEAALFAVVLACSGCGSSRAEDFRKGPPLWDGRQTVAQYAKRAGLKATETMDLGDGVKLELALIPAGKFLMGSPENEEGRSRNEGPQHEVTISQPFYMGKYEVTTEQYVQIRSGNSSNNRNDTGPAARINWHECLDFCNKLSARSGKTVRLPTEAEWEYVCRAGTQTRFYTGDRDEDLARAGWYGSDKAIGNSGPGAHRVGEKLANAFGLYDMHGNLWEWCNDWFSDKYYAESPKVDPQGPALSPSNKRVLRGGSFYHRPAECRSAFRFEGNPWDGHHYYGGVGFRVVVAVSSKTL
jgi:formylglycine-generating enzyme required for sulfatase activity